ncbi:hypothetical protein [Aquibacillus salsiterrae]|uniref:Uncharacterized protein n=1 Tax=Aquibacillus salsiterrae TaxID=2950439 RepID=A0A9X3WJM1_9BACI|nr:hypothetical protein [Aquibacillus salsiterrae]MDC3418276.1 hypothetical protein [Aquibacillus salsiterrae]
MSEKKIPMRIIGVIAIIVLLVLPTIKPNRDVFAEDDYVSNSHVLSNKGEQPPKQQVEKVELTHDELVKITDEFIRLLVQQSDSNNKVINYQSKEMLVEAFKSIATKEVAKPYIDYYFEEKDSGLYIVPTETPPWFEKDQKYEMIDIGNNKVKISQSNQNELYGEYKIELELTYSNKWRLTSISHG